MDMIAPVTTMTLGRAATSPLDVADVKAFLASPLPNDPDALSERAELILLFEGWIEKIKTAIEEALRDGAHVSGYKLVRKRVRSEWQNADEAKKMLIGLGVPEHLLMTDPELISPSKAAHLGRHIHRTQEAMKQLVESLSFCPVGEITIVPDTDKRSAIDPSEINDRPTVRPQLRTEASI